MMIVGKGEERRERGKEERRDRKVFKYSRPAKGSGYWPYWHNPLHSAMLAQRASVPHAGEARRLGGR
jgi:hypothetical protein